MGRTLRLCSRSVVEDERPYSYWPIGRLGFSWNFLFGGTFHYPFTWVSIRRQELRRVLNAYYDFMESLPPDQRIGQQAKTLWDALLELRNGLHDPNWQLERQKENHGGAGGHGDVIT